MKNAGLIEAQAGIRFAGGNINNNRYAESETKLKWILMKMEEESEKVGFKLNVQKTKIMASGPITSWQIYGGTVEDFFFFFPCKLHVLVWLFGELLPVVPLAHPCTNTFPHAPYQPCLLTIATLQGAAVTLLKPE